MALGGGTFTVHNKVLPGSYINFTSAERTNSNLTERGTATIAVVLDWGKEQEVFTVTKDDFNEQVMEIFGHEMNSPKLKGIRDLFKHATKVHFYRLNKGVKAANAIAEAKFGGSRGNSITIRIQNNVDESGKVDVTTLMDSKKLDVQTVATAAELKENAYVIFKSDASLEVTAGTPLTGGNDGQDVTGEDYQDYLNKIESYSFHTIGCLSSTKTVVSMFQAFTKRMREEVGAKFQLVTFRGESDYEGIIDLENEIVETEDGFSNNSLIYWLVGAEAACLVYRDCTNMKYDGEFEIKTEYTQRELKEGLQNGKLLFHKSGDNICILEDINSLVTYTEEKNDEFASNQTIRVLDQVGNDIAKIYNDSYIGAVNNSDMGRKALWNDIVTYLKELEKLGAIENFQSESVTVEKGEGKKEVVVNCAIIPVNSMKQLYMTVVVE